MIRDKERGTTVFYKRNANSILQKQNTNKGNPQTESNFDEGVELFCQYL